MPMPEIEEVDTTGGVPEEEVPEEEAVEPGSDADLERFFLKVKCTKEEALTAKHLQWGWKEMGKEDGAALAFVIRNNPVCITLDLFVNEIYEEAGALVGLALKDNVKLKSLDLQQAQIGVEGGRAIAEASGAHQDTSPPARSQHSPPILAPGQALRTNTTLMNLKLYYNCLGPVGTKAIAEALQAPQPCAHVEPSAVGTGPALSPRRQPLHPSTRPPAHRVRKPGPPRPCQCAGTVSLCTPRDGPARHASTAPALLGLARHSGLAPHAARRCSSMRHARRPLLPPLRPTRS